MTLVVFCTWNEERISCLLPQVAIHPRVLLAFFCWHKRCHLLMRLGNPDDPWEESLGALANIIIANCKQQQQIKFLEASNSLSLLLFYLSFIPEAKDMVKMEWTVFKAVWRCTVCASIIRRFNLSTASHTDFQIHRFKQWTVVVWL